MDAWKAVEETAVATRKARVRDTLAKLIGPSASPDHDPRIGLCLSGGGWRAMTSACALFDALCTPLEATETASNTAGIKLLDTVTHAFGLSGGSWMLFTTLVGGQRNPFHTGPVAGGPAPPHPWLYGTANAFDEAVHRYDGLAHMVSKDNVDRACYRSSTRQTLSMLSSKMGADSTIPSAMVSSHLGKSLVERWSNFIANNILNFVDGFKVHNIPNEVVPGDASGRVETDDGKGNASRRVEFGSVKQLIEAGDLPFVVCSAIANRPLAEGEKPGKFTRGYDWTEFTPYFSRNPPKGLLVSQTDELQGYFADGRADADLVRLKVHNLMAICGSAFACDVACALPESVSSVVSTRVTVTSDPLLGGGVTDVVFGADKKTFGVLRDAGIDFNIPLPPMLPEASRAFDIIVVHDGGAGSKNAHELQRAVDLGFIKLAPAPFTPETPFLADEKVRVFRGAPGYPTVIYFLGLTERGTHQIALNQKALIADVKRCRENALHQLIPVLLSEIRIARAMKAAGAVAGVAETVAATVGPTKTVAFKKSAGAKANNDPNASDEEEEYAAAASLEAEGQQQAPKMNDLAQGFVVNGMAMGKVKDSLDAYQLIESAIFTGVPDTKRLNSLTTLEIRGLKVLEGGQAQTALPPFNTEIASADLNELMTDFGVMERREGSPQGSKDTDLSVAWAEYFAAVAILSTLAPNDGLKVLARVGCPPSVASDKLAGFSLTALPEGCKVWSLLSVGAKKLADAIPAANILTTFYQTLATSAATQLQDIVSRATSIDTLEDTVALLVRNVCLVYVEHVASAADTAALQSFAALFAQLVAVVQGVAPPRFGYDAGDLATAFGCYFARIGQFPLLCVVLGAGSSSGGVKAAVQPFTSARREEQLLDILDAGCTVDSKQRQQQMLALFDRELKTVPTYELCVKYAFPRLIRPFVAKHLDDRASVTALLDATTRHAVRAKRRAAEFTVCEIWNEGAASHEFRGWIASECMQRRYYWDFVAPRVLKVEIPADPAEAQEAVAFAEKCRRLQQVDVKGNLGHNLLTRLNGVQQRAHEKRLAAEQGLSKLASSVAAAASGKLSGLAGKFGFGKK